MNQSQVIENSGSKVYDVLIVGAGISGSFIADELTRSGLSCLALEAGQHFTAKTYPKNDLDGNSQLYWGGGIEFNDRADLGILRPKVVGGGSIVNQALVDRFDDNAFDSWRAATGVSFLNLKEMNPWYEKAEKELSLQEIPAKYRNQNAEIFFQGFNKNGYQLAPLRRAQKDCRYHDGNDCIVCLNGCPIDSKQSMPVTVLKKALSQGLDLVSEFEVMNVESTAEGVSVGGLWRKQDRKVFRAKKLVLASGAIGNSRLLLKSGLNKALPQVGNGFYTHPQFMVLALYEKAISAHRGPFQAFKSADPQFRKKGFKLENVFAPPVGISMLVPGFGREHMKMMKQYNHMACIEVAVRDTQPGQIQLQRDGRARVKKFLNSEDLRRKADGMEAIQNIFGSTGAQKIIPGAIGIGLHLMGGCGIGTDSAKSVVSPDFHLHGNKNIFAADSSIFPNAPGINPSLTIMALSKKAAASILQQGWGVSA